MNTACMKRFLFYYVFLSFNLIFGQEIETPDWVDEIQTEIEIADKLQILQNHFKDSSAIPVIINGQPVSRLNSSFSFNDPEKFIKTIRLAEIKTIEVFGKKASQVLYGVNNVILITLVNEKLMFDIRKRIN